MWTRFSFKHKLIISYFILTLLPIIAMGISAYKYLEINIRNHMISNLTATLKQMENNAYYKIEIAERMSEQLFSDTILQKELTKSYEGYERYQLVKEVVKPRFDSILNLSKETAVVSLYVENKDIPEIFYYDESNPDPLSTDKKFQIYNINSVREQKWFNDMELDTHNPKWLQVERDKEFGNISLLRNFIDFDKPQIRGFYRINIKLSNIFQAINYRNIGERSSLIVLGSEDEVLYKSLAGNFNEASLNVNKNFIVIKEPMRGGKWTLVAFIPKVQIEKSVKELKFLTIGLCILVFILSGLVGILISKYFSKNVYNLITLINSYKDGDFRKRIQYYSNDEFGQIGCAFNQMAKNTDELIKKVYLSDLQKKEAELQLLQAQINPHFLYNTLSSISRLAQLGYMDKLQQTIIELSKFYRLSLNKGKMIISVKDEIDQARSYVNIQQIKNGNRMEVQYTIDSEVFQFHTVKFILQPFIENILEHALYGEKIFIRLIAYKEEECLIFKIVDNGVGMKRDLVEQLMNSEGNKIGYGINNVNDRIKLQFGSEYGVSIFSRIGIGTTVKIRIPAIRQ